MQQALSLKGEVVKIFRHNKHVSMTLRRVANLTEKARHVCIFEESKNSNWGQAKDKLFPLSVIIDL